MMARFAQHVGLTVWASALAAGMDEALLDGQYALALSSHEPSFSPGALVSPFLRPWWASVHRWVISSLGRRGQAFPTET